MSIIALEPRADRVQGGVVYSGEVCVQKGFLGGFTEVKFPLGPMF